MRRRTTSLLLAAVLAPEVCAFGRLGDALFGGSRHSAARALEEQDGEPCANTAPEHECTRWATAGECDANPGYMTNNCRLACNKCPPKPYLSREERAKCTDVHRECSRWAAEEECDKNPKFMHDECKASCRECQSLTCYDTHRECADWAAAGECKNNSNFMMEECKFSCAVCHVNFKAECRRDPKMDPKAVPGTVDETFRRALDYFPHYGPTVLHRDPWVVHFENFLTGEEVDHVLATAGARFERSLAGDGVTPVRTSTTSWCNVDSCLKDLRFQEIRERIVNLTRVPWENAEHLQVLKYEPGQFYKEHHDQNSPKNSAWGPRLYTFFMYLSDVEAGGETRFTRLNISVAPKKGSAILWPSVFNDDPWSTDERTYHEAVTVREGVKYSANFWIHMFEFQKALGRGCDNSDYFQDHMQESKGGYKPRAKPRSHS